MTEHKDENAEVDLDALIAIVMDWWNHATPAEREETVRRSMLSFVSGNVALSNPLVTREMVEEAAARHV